MSQDALSRAPLPGLTKLYLVLIYSLALTMICSRLALTALGLKGGMEPLIWSIVFFIYGVFSIIAIAGIHSRAGWARSAAAKLSLWLCLLCAAGIVRIFISINQLHYGLDFDDVFTVFAPAMLGMYIPIFFAWQRYFSASTKLDAALGAGRGGVQLPPVGVGILQTISASCLLFYLVFFLILGICGGKEAFTSGGYLLLAESLPQVVFFSAFLALALRSGKEKKPLLIALVAFALVTKIWSHTPYVLFIEIGDFSIYKILKTFGSVPMSDVSIVVFALLLVWKIWADPSEQSWFAGEPAAGPAPSKMSLYNIVLLYYSLGCMTSALLNFCYYLNERSKTPPLFSVPMFALMATSTALHGLALYNRKAKRWSDKKLSAISFAASAVIALLVLGILVLDMFSPNEFTNKVAALSYAMPTYMLILGAALMAMGQWRAEYAQGRENAAEGLGFYRLSAPLHAFAIFCVLLMVAMLGGKLSDISRYLLSYGEDYIYLPDGSSLGDVLFDFEFWAAYAICPLLALKWLRAGLTKCKNFYVLAVVWICAMISSIVSNLLTLVARGGYYDFNYAVYQIVSPKKQLYIYVIIMFMIYLAKTWKKTPHEVEKL